MADLTLALPDVLPTNGTDPLAPPAPKWPTKPKKPFTLDAETYVESVRTRLTALREDQTRSHWKQSRIVRYQKYRGSAWTTAAKTEPWPGCADSHPPLLQIAELRANAGLGNVVQSMRPLLRAKASGGESGGGRRDAIAREEKITALIDAQMFTDLGPARAERIYGDYISNFLQDGDAVAYTPWVRDVREATHYVYRPPVRPGMDPEAYLVSILQETLPGFDEASILRDAEKEHVYTGTIQKAPDARKEEFTVTVYQDEDGYLTLLLRRPTLAFDGPVPLNVALERVWFPSASENLQPPSDANPAGAPYVFLEVDYGLDQVRAHQQSGQFNWMTAETVEAIEAVLRGEAGTPPFDGDARSLQRQKQAMAGTTPSTPPVETDADLVHLTVRALKGFDRWTIDGVTEDICVVLAVDRAGDPTHLLEARRLSELYPGDRPWRPLAEAHCIPVPGTWYSIGLLELGEQLYDLVKGLLDQTLDANAITTIPFFFYSATSKMATDRMKLAPGEGFPVPGDPRSTVYFPNLPQRDQASSFQLLTLGIQLFERLLMIGDMQLGRVPTGKASALRTVGTTMALLQQGDVRADQLLLRLFTGLQQIASYFHRMNRHLLPPGKEVRRIGWDGAREQAYVTFERGNPDVDFDLDFEFRPDFLLSNPQVMAATLQGALAVLATPLGFESKVITPTQFYRLLRDYLKANKLDWQQYLQPPPGETGEAILAEEAIQQLTQGQMPIGPPMEGPDAHMQKLTAWVQSDQFGFLGPSQVQVVKAYWQRLGERIQTARLANAAGGFQESLAQTLAVSGAGSSGAETTGQAPEISMQAPGGAESAAPSPSESDYGG